MTSSTTTTKKPQTTPVEAYSPEQIRASINLMVNLNQPDLQQALAQVIAGAIADSDSTAMRWFASTGSLKAEAVLDELDHIQVPFEQEAWVDALARYVLFTSGGRS